MTETSASGLQDSEIARLDALLEATGGALDAEELGAALGRLLPRVKCRHCEAADVLEDPFRATERVEIHLLDLQAHCIAVTDDPRHATGLLLATVPPESAA